MDLSKLQKELEKLLTDWSCQVQWTNKPIEEATWEIYGDLIARFLGFDAVNEAVPRGQGKLKGNGVIRLR
ncbi:hypothetical protein Tco_1207692 [Tanacetum coccineum]